MAKVSRKIFRKDSKYKLKVHMQKISAVQNYVDVDMDDNNYKRADIRKYWRLKLTGNQLLAVYLALMVSYFV